jgi:hypothetical protein
VLPTADAHIALPHGKLSGAELKIYSLARWRAVAD